MSFGISKRSNGRNNQKVVPIGPSQSKNQGYSGVIGTVGDREFIIKPPVALESFGKDLVLKSGDGVVKDGKIICNINGDEILKMSEKYITFHKSLKINNGMNIKHSSFDLEIKPEGLDGLDSVELPPTVNVSINDPNIFLNITFSKPLDKEIKITINTPVEDRLVYYSSVCEKKVNIQLLSTTETSMEYSIIPLAPITDPITLLKLYYMMV